MAEMDETIYRSELWRLRLAQTRAHAELHRISEELYRLAAPRGDEPHHHGDGTYTDPSRSHSHPYTDENHEHPPRSAEDAPWPEGD